MDPHHVGANPDSTYNPDADPDSDFLLDEDLDADPDPYPDPCFKKGSNPGKSAKIGSYSYILA